MAIFDKRIVPDEIDVVNFVILPKDEQSALPKWLERGFVPVADSGPYCFECDIELSYVLTRQPLTLATFCPEQLIGQRIAEVHNLFGTYGMGGCGFMGFKFRVGDCFIWLVIGLWNGEAHLTLDGRVFTCAKENVNVANPWYFGFAKHPENSRDPFYRMLCTLTISAILLADGTLRIQTSDPAGGQHELTAALAQAERVYVIPDQTNLMF